MVMNRFVLKKAVTSIIFVIFLFTFSIVNFKVSYKPLMESLKKESSNSDTFKEKIDSVNYAMEGNVLGKYNFVDTYGYIQKLMGKNEENNFEVAKDKEGILHYTFFAEQPNAVYDLVKRTKAFKSGLKNKNTKFIYMMPPDKYIEGYTKYSTGIPYSYVNETTNEFLKLLKQNKIDTIDLRKNLSKSGIKPDQLFFKTDHHWTTQTAFWEFQQFVGILKNKYGVNADPDGIYTNKENYNFIKYHNSYIGSMGRKTGIPYSGVDDFTLIYPKFKTSYSYYSKTGNQEVKLNGRFEEALLTVSPFTTKKGTYALEADKYSSYLFGNQGITHVVNKDNPNGPKILFVKDSFTVPMAAFLSTVCSDIYLVDPRYYEGDIPKFVNSVNANFVFISFSPEDLTSEFFKFYEDK